ncbi:MAG: DUF6624 domain-containing protein [Bacteroidota bacterium]
MFRNTNLCNPNFRSKKSLNHLIICCWLNTSCQTKWRGKKILLPEISKEIIQMGKKDQKYRMKWRELNTKGEKGTEKYNKVTRKLIEIDRSNTARMEEIIDEHGWPTYAKVGEEASNAAWLIVQHADRNPFFQEKSLLLLGEEVDRGQINPSNYAYLYDRVQIARGEKQRYGTQSTTNHNVNSKTAGFQPIEDESNVQKRREAMNIQQHIEHYALSLNFHYTIPSEAEALEIEKKLKAFYEWNVKKAKETMNNNNYKAAVNFYRNALSCYGHISSEDFVEAARAMSLSKDKEVGLATFYLLNAAFKGYDDITKIDSNPDFKFLKEENLDFWKNDLMRTIKKHGGNGN